MEPAGGWVPTSKASVVVAENRKGRKEARAMRAKTIHAACQTLGHFACDDQDHTAAPCGEHFVCEEGYDAAQHAQCPGCGVYVCSEGYVAEEHAQCETCGGYLCDGKDHNHAPSGETGSGETL